MSSLAQELKSRGWGILQTGLSSLDLERLYSDWRAFFWSSSKSEYMARPGHLEGYFPFASEVAGSTDRPDPKEFFHFYDWGPCPAACRETTFNAFTALKSAAERGLRSLQAADPALIGTLPAWTSSQLVLRVASYSAGAVGGATAAAHSDVNLITILPPATGSGLQVCDQSGRWDDIPAVPKGHAVVLAGDMLREASGGRFQSTIHRVLGNGVERLSLSLFVNPEMGTMFPSGRTAADLFRARSGQLLSGASTISSRCR